MNTKQFPIFYFSGTGNTWWVGQQLEAALNSRGFQSQAISIEQISPEDAAAHIDQAEMIGLGYPIYGLFILPKDKLSAHVSSCKSPQSCAPLLN